MLFSWLFGDSPERAPTASDELRALCAQSMPGADAESVAVGGALAGLLATVAHADQNYTDAEREAVRGALATVHGLAPGALGAVEQLLRAHIA